MKTFDEYWATTGPWPDNILTAAFKEVGEKAWRAGRASVVSQGVLVALDEVIPRFHGHPGMPCWLGCTELTPGQPYSLRPDVPEPAEGWTEHRARGCESLHVDETCPDGFGPKEHCPIRLAGNECLAHPAEPAPGTFGGKCLCTGDSDCECDCFNCQGHQ